MHNTIYRRVWPVLDDTCTYGALLREAKEDLQDALIDEDLLPDGDVHWYTQQTGDGSLELVAEMAVRPDVPNAEHDEALLRPSPLTQRKRLRQATVAALTAEGLSTTAIADRLGVSERSVTRDRAALVRAGVLAAA